MNRQKVLNRTDMKFQIRERNKTSVIFVAFTRLKQILSSSTVVWSVNALPYLAVGSRPSSNLKQCLIGCFRPCACRYDILEAQKPQRRKIPMNAAVNAFFLILKLLSLYFLVVSLFCLCRRKSGSSAGQRRFASIDRGQK